MFAPRAFPRTSLGYIFMPFNRRGHDSASTYDSRECVGGAYQTITKGVEDNELAAEYLKARGFPRADSNRAQ